MYYRGMRLSANKSSEAELPAKMFNHILHDLAVKICEAANATLSNPSRTLLLSNSSSLVIGMVTRSVTMYIRSK